MFFIDDDESEVGERGEDCAPCPDDDAGFPSADAVPFVVAFSVGEVAMKDCHFVPGAGETRFESFDGLRGERDFRDEHDGVSS